MAIIKSEEYSVRPSEEFFTAGGTAVYRKTQNGGFVNLVNGLLLPPSDGVLQPMPVGYKFTVEVDK